jgi:hypothetical protein
MLCLCQVSNPARPVCSQTLLNGLTQIYSNVLLNTLFPDSYNLCFRDNDCHSHTHKKSVTGKGSASDDRLNRLTRFVMESVDKNSALEKREDDVD